MRKQASNVADFHGSTMTPAMHIEARLKCIETATALAIAKGKPSHAVFIAADLYQFIVNGEKPVLPDRTETKAPEELVFVRKV